MNLFETYPQLAQTHASVLHGRSLRLISLSGIVYDDRACYFELGDQRLWGRLPGGRVSIGVGAAKVPPDGAAPPHRALVRYLRKQWRCDVTLVPTGFAYVLGEDGRITVLDDVAAATPYFFILTPPRLGGGEIPDALVQAIYLLPVRRWRSKARLNLVKIDRAALPDFLEPKDWDARELQAQPWAAVQSIKPLPENARLRPILALRGLQQLLQNGVLPFDLSTSSEG